MNSSAADYFHPAVTFAYAVSMTIMAMIFFNPVFIVIGLIFAVIQNIMLLGPAHLARQLKWSLPMCVLVALFNPIVSSSGRTFLFYLFGNPVTLEALFYGLCSGGMLLLIFLWFSIYNRIVSPDRFMYLFSRAAPSVSMIVMMTQRMIPMFSRKFDEISAVQKTLFPSEGETGLKKRIAMLKLGMRKISILLSLSMENGLDTADSMKARGYGNGKRSAFSVYRFGPIDAAALTAEIIISSVCVFLYYSVCKAQFYPAIIISSGPGTVVCAVVFAVYAAFPAVIETWFSSLWRKQALCR